VDQVFVIGVRLNPDDHHIWDVLRTCKGELYYVGPEGKQVMAWAEEQGRTGVHHLADDFKKAVQLLTSGG
jgi:hypothetical protein